MKLSPHDYILAETKFGNQVLAKVNRIDQPGERIWCSPKYIPFNLTRVKFFGHSWRMLNKDWSRVIPSKKFDYIFKKYFSEFIPNTKILDEFLIDTNSIKQTFGCKQIAQKILNEKNGMNDTRKKIQKILKFIRRKHYIQNIGITGSSLFSGEIDGFSDIDIVAYGSKIYSKLCKNFYKSRFEMPVHFRNLKEWEQYYNKMNVVAPYNGKIFAKHQIHKYNQFIFDGTRVMITPVPTRTELDQLSNFNSTYEEEKLGQIKVNGIVTDDKLSVFFNHSFYSIYSPTYGKIRIENFLRACAENARYGEKIEVRGFAKRVKRRKEFEKKVVINFGNKGYIKNLDWLKDEKKFLIFDCYGTIFNEGKESIPIIIDSIFKDNDLKVEKEVFSDYWSKKYFNLEGKIFKGNVGNFKTIYDINLESLRATFKKFYVKQKPETYVDNLFRRWSKPALFPDFKIILKNLYPYNVGILTNTDNDTLLSALKYNNLNFDYILTSEMAKSYKPDEKIFQKAISDLKTSKSNIIYIGNSFNDIIGAKKAGIKVIWVNRKNRILSEKIARPDFEVKRLNQIFQFI